MSRQSNKALEKFNTPTADSIARKQAKELVDDEYNDIRRQLIRRQFDQVNLYNELFNRDTENFGDILLDHKLMELFNKYIQEIGESRRRLGENRPNPFNDLIGAYNAFTSSLSSYVEIAKKKNTRVNTKAFEDKLRESAIPLQELLNVALGMVSGAVPSIPVAAAPAVSAVEAPGLVAEREDRRRPAYEDEHLDNPFLARPRLTPQQDAAERLRRFEAANQAPPYQPDPRVVQLDQNYQNALALARQSGMGKAHGGDMGDFLKRFAINFAKNKRIGQGDGGSLFAPRPGPQAQPARNPPPGPGRLHVYNRNTGSYVWRDMSARARGGYRAFGSRRPTTYTGGNTDMFWKFLLGAGKTFGGNKPTENDILDLFNLLKEVQRGFVPNQPFRGVSAMTDAEKKNQKAKLGAFEGAYSSTSDFSAAFVEVAEFLSKDRVIDTMPPENGLTYSAEEIQAFKDNGENAIQDFINEVSRSELAQKGDYRPGEKEILGKELKELNKKLNDTIKYMTRYGRGRGKAHGGKAKTDTNFGQLVAESEARNPRKKNCHYNTRGFLISCSGKKGGQAGFSMEKTREIVDQWPGFPYYVPPASKTGPMLKNPRSRVNNRTEANGKPRRICKRDMSAEAIACRNGEDPPKRGRPRKLSPKSPKGGKRICKMDMSEGSIACRNADKPKKSTMPKPRMPGPAKPKAAGKKLSKLNEKLYKIDKDLGKKLAESEKNKAAGKKKAKKSGKPKYNVI